MVISPLLELDEGNMTMIKRGVRQNGVLYRAGDEQAEKDLAAVLSPEDAKRLQERGFLDKKFKATGKKEQLDPNTVETRSLGQRQAQKATFQRADDVVRPEGVERDEETGEPERTPMSPATRDVAAQKEVGKGSTAKKNAPSKPQGANPFARETNPDDTKDATE